MSRFSRYDTDEERLPEGMTRVGYDADTQVYTFQDADGSYWESAPGNQYGQLTRVGSGPAEDSEDTDPFLDHDAGPTPSWRHDMMPLLNFGVLIGLSLIFIFWYISRPPSSPQDEQLVACAGRSVSVQDGDTCWDLAQKEGVSVDDILHQNIGLDCAKLIVGSRICLSD